MKKWKPRARGRSYPIKRPTCHISIVVKDISLDKYIETFPWLKKPRWKNKDRNMIYHNMDSSWGGMGQKINPLGFRLDTIRVYHRTTQENDKKNNF
ncbi:hypothetical protein RHMOL_Rhmol06G0207000 [Rhododendron molle]|uniref:Uncharacterized protein n=1 Tax=Rhododendron molle TaxID=49168 RepID=A0ACC0NFM8_RHOML|nr:hypothetical protein RHMOL_Rhmol06G0207000 [Rhododendron molle]